MPPRTLERKSLDDCYCVVTAAGFRRRRRRRCYYYCYWIFFFIFSFCTRVLSRAAAADYRQPDPNQRNINGYRRRPFDSPPCRSVRFIRFGIFRVHSVSSHYSAAYQRIRLCAAEQIFFALIPFVYKTRLCIYAHVCDRTYVVVRNYQCRRGRGDIKYAFITRPPLLFRTVIRSRTVNVIVLK